jgi:serine/threonine-protein kinase ATR
MTDADLCDEAFAVWANFLQALDAEDTMLIVDQTFALIVQHWASFSEHTQLRANATVLDLTKKYDSQLRERIEYLPSLATIPMMSKTEAELVRLKANVDTIRTFQSFVNRCKDQNAVVVRQALKELVPFLDANQKHLHQSIVGQKPLEVLAALSRSLLDASVRFSEDHLDISVLCARSLGVIGGSDPYRVETIREKKRVLMLSNFSRRDEDIDFVALLLEQVLVKVFLSTTNATAQGWIAYVMQEMLKHCGFSALAVSKSRSSQPSTESQRWNEIPEAVRNVLTPFLSSRYSVNLNPTLRYKSPKYPIFGNSISHGTWLQTFVYDLLQKGQGVNVEMVFPVLARVIRGFDLSIATFILPFAALNVIVSDNEQNVTDIGKELLAVMESEIRSPDQVDAALIKQCSEVSFEARQHILHLLIFGRMSFKPLITSLCGFKRKEKPLRRPDLWLEKLAEASQKKTKWRPSNRSVAWKVFCKLSRLRLYLAVQWSVDPMPVPFSTGSNTIANSSNSRKRQTSRLRRTIYCNTCNRYTPKLTSLTALRVSLLTFES